MITKRHSSLGILTLLLLVTICGNTLADLSDGLIAHWGFDELEGNIAYDSIGNHDGTIHGASWTDGIIAGALHFTGPSNFIQVPHSSIGNPTGSFTMSAWARLTDEGSGGPYGDNDCIIAKICAHKGYCIEYNWNSTQGIRAGFGTGSAWRRLYGSPWQLLDWHHVVLVYDQNTSTFALFDNGVLQSSHEGDSPVYSSDNLRFGNSQCFYNQYFPGDIDDILFYDRALSADEVLQLYEQGLSPYEAAVDIKPGSCPNPLNLVSKGVLPVAILGSADFDINSVDAVSIRLADIPAIRHSYKDVTTPVIDSNECECSVEGPDGYLDLTLKFKTQQIVEELVNSGEELVGGQRLRLALTGKFTDGTSMVATDCVVLVGNVSKWLAAKRWDGNADGAINFLDLAELAQYWLETSED